MLTKTCSKCGLDKAVSEFHRHKQSRDGLKSRCKQCNRDEARAFYRKNPEPYLERVGEHRRKGNRKRMEELDSIRETRGCCACGEKTLCVLDFHHLIGNSKGKLEGMPVTRAAHKSWKAMRTELAKCVIVCANCHRKVHAGLIVLDNPHSGGLHEQQTESLVGNADGREGTRASIARRTRRSK